MKLLESGLKLQAGGAVSLTELLSTYGYYKRPAEQASATLTSVHILVAAKQASSWLAVHQGGCPAHPCVSVRFV